MLLTSNKQHKEVPKIERQKTQKSTVGKNKDQLHYNMNTQFMCPYIPFQTSLTGQKRWDVVYAGHSSSLPNNMHTKFMCPSLYHFPNSSYRSEEMGKLVMLATLNLYPTIVLIPSFFGTTSSKFSKARQTNISYFNEISFSYNHP
jgi:hypothetical protein